MQVLRQLLRVIAHARWAQSQVLPFVLAAEQKIFNKRNETVNTEEEIAISTKILLNHVTLLDGADPEPQPDMAVVVDGRNISWVGPAPAAAAAGCREIDFAGAYLCPGLWDLHVHLDYRGISAPPEPTDMVHDVLFAYRRLLTYLHGGVTSLRILGTENAMDLSLRGRIDSGEYIGPRLIAAGKPLYSTGGHGSEDGSGLDGPVEFRRAARRNFWEGADLLKVMVTGGIAGRRERWDALQTRPEEVQAAAETAQAWKKHTAAHVSTAAAAKICVSCGVDSIEHGYALDEQALTLMAEQGTVYVPTLVVTDAPQYWQDIGTPQWAREKMADASAAHHRAVELALELGVTMGIGSDVPEPILDGALATIAEMEALESMGAGPGDVLTWAWQTGPKLCGREELVGTITPGREADCVALPANPLDAVGALRDIFFVMSRGCVVRDDRSCPGTLGLLAGKLEYPHQQ